MNRSHPSKIILFGEYAVIKGADALIVPFHKYCGHLEITGLEVDKELWKFFESLNDSRILKTQMNLDKFEKDIKKGMRFISTIPQGMGLGSSGALCSAVFDKYAFKKDVELSLLKEYFSIMESHFHGKSSGIDPLVAYMDKCLYTDKDHNVTIVDRPRLSSLGAFYLLNSNIQRHTAPLVHSFLKDFSSPTLDQELKKYIKLSNTCIQNVFDCEKKSFSSNISEISKFQLKYFRNMIPKNLIRFWEDGLNSDDYTLKLCGAGGGGFFICYSHNKNLNYKNLTLIS